MKAYELIIIDDEGRHEIKAVAILAFEERGNQVVTRVFDNHEIPESWWRMVIGKMASGLDKAMADRRERYKKAEL